MDKYIFIGGIYPEIRINEIMDKFGCLPQDAADMFQKNLINGLEDNLKCPVTVFNTYFLPSSFLKFEKVSPYEWDGKYGKNYNLSYTRNRFFGFNSKCNSIVKSVSEWIDNNAQNDNVNVIIYPAYFPFLKAVSILKKKYKIRVCLVVPDLPDFMGLTSNRSIHNKMSELYSLNRFNKYIDSVDSFILLTEYMNDVVNTYKKPYRVIEGIAPYDYKYGLRNKDITERRIVYSGRLQLKYGIENYLKAISLIDDDTLFFDFYGNGEGVDIIKEYSKKDSRVRFMGYLLADELHLVHQNSLMLINPRQNEFEFTRYSFPSKTLEYMMSGRPVIAYKLDGMPDEYSDYIISPKGNSPEKLAELISEYASLSELELDEIGKKGRDFVIKNKNSTVQAIKIIELFNI